MFVGAVLLLLVFIYLFFYFLLILLCLAVVGLIALLPHMLHLQWLH